MSLHMAAYPGSFARLIVLIDVFSAVLPIWPPMATTWEIRWSLLQQAVPAAKSPRCIKYAAKSLYGTFVAMRQQLTKYLQGICLWHAMPRNRFTAIQKRGAVMNGAPLVVIQCAKDLHFFLC